MVITCPACSARMRLTAARFEGKRITVRCLRCREVFKSRIARSGHDAELPAVLVAHSDPELCKTIGQILDLADIPYATCHDGEEALEALRAKTPDVLLIDVALPGLFAFEVVDKVRSFAGLEQVRIILLSSVYNKMAYKRRPDSLYGADDYIEKHHLPDLLVPKVLNVASGKEQEEVAAAQQTEDWVPPDQDSLDYCNEVNREIRSAEEREVTARSNEEALSKARRLARIIISDIVLYNQSRVEKGLRDGNLATLLEAELAEGRRLFAERVPETVQAQEDFLRIAFEAFVSGRQGDPNC